MGEEPLKGSEILTLSSPGLFDLPANSLSCPSPEWVTGWGHGTLRAHLVQPLLQAALIIRKTPPYIETHCVAGIRVGSVRPLTLLNLVLPQGFCTCCSLCLTCSLLRVLQGSFLSVRYFPNVTQCEKPLQNTQSRVGTLTLYHLILIFLFICLPI